MNFSGVNYLGTALKFRKVKKNLSSLVYRPPQNLKLGIFTSQLCTDGKEKKCTKKKAWCACRAVVLLNKPITILMSSMPSLSLLLNTQWRIQVSASGGPSPLIFRPNWGPKGGIIGSLSNSVFGRRTSTGSGLFAALGCGWLKPLGKSSLQEKRNSAIQIW